MRGVGDLRSDAPRTEKTPWVNALVVRPLAHFLVSVILMWLLYGVFGARGHLLYMWPITGIQIAILLSGSQDWKSCWLQIVTGAVGMFLAALALGTPLWRSLEQPAMHALELWALRHFMGKQIARFDDLKRQTNVLRFCSSAILVPIFAALLLAQPLATMARPAYAERALLLR